MNLPLNMRYITLTLVFVGLMLLASCSTLTVQDVTTTSQKFVIEDYFQGETKAYGLLFDRSGKVTRQFEVDLRGHWDEQQQLLTLDEKFLFDDGERDFRQWQIKRINEGEYTGQADDVVGEAIGRSEGNAMLWRYSLIINYKGRDITVNIEDWMYKNNGVLINRATLRKFGLKVGELVISFHQLGS
ncbi:MAG: DUF3833 domain-containing protein [Granulosicoccaceae bacterium]